MTSNDEDEAAEIKRAIELLTPKQRYRMARLALTGITFRHATLTPYWKIVFQGHPVFGHDTLPRQIQRAYSDYHDLVEPQETPA